MPGVRLLAPLARVQYHAPRILQPRSQAKSCGLRIVRDPVLNENVKFSAALVTRATDHGCLLRGWVFGHIALTDNNFARTQKEIRLDKGKHANGVVTAVHCAEG